MAEESEGIGRGHKCLRLQDPAQSLPTRRKKTCNTCCSFTTTRSVGAKGYAVAELGEYRAFGKEFADAIKGGHALPPTRAAATVRVRDGKRLTMDGPFAETKEQLGGYYLVEARDREEAIDIAAKIPGARFGSIEVRPIMTFS